MNANISHSKWQKLSTLLAVKRATIINYYKREKQFEILWKASKEFRPLNNTKWLGKALWKGKEETKCDEEKKIWKEKILRFSWLSQQHLSRFIAWQICGETRKIGRRILWGRIESTKRSNDNTKISHLK